MMDILRDIRLEERNKHYLKVTDEDEMRKKRDEGSVELRKKKRFEHFSKRRAVGTGANRVAEDPTENDSENFEIDAEWISTELKKLDPRLSNNSYTPLQLFMALASHINPVSDLKMLREAVGSLRKILSECKAFPFGLILTSGCSLNLIQLLSHENLQVKIDAASCLINISSGPLEIGNALIDQNVVNAAYKALISKASIELMDNCAWTLSNLAANSVVIRDKIIKAGTVSFIVKYLQENSNLSVGYVRDFT